jgi:hypothetical protein
MAPPIRKQRPTGRMTPPAKSVQSGRPSAQAAQGSSLQKPSGQGMQTKGAKPVGGPKLPGC